MLAMSHCLIISTGSADWHEQMARIHNHCQQTTGPKMQHALSV